MTTPARNLLNPQSHAADEQYSFGYSTIPQDVVLVANTPQTITIPAPDSQANPYTKVSFNATASIWVNFNGQTAIVPASNTGPSNMASVLNPSTKLITGMESFSIISAVACLVSLEWFQ